MNTIEPIEHKGDRRTDSLPLIRVQSILNVVNGDG